MSVKSNNAVAAPANHHYIPKFYQRGFIKDDSNRIWVYEKGRAPRRYFTGKTGMRIALYGFTNNRNEFDMATVEKELAKIDSDGANVIQKLDRGKLLKDKERLRLCRFVSVMWRRTPKHKEQVERMAAEMMPELLGQFDEVWLRRKIEERSLPPAKAEQLFEQQKAELVRLRERYAKQVPDFLFATNTLRDSIFEHVMYEMDWAFFRAAPGTEFLTCDDPAVFNKGTGLKDREAVIMFPLSRKLFLQAMHISDYGNTHHQLSAAKVEQLNTYVVQSAHKQVYASQHLESTASLVNEQICTFWRADNSASEGTE